MNFLIAETFTDSLARLTGEEQKAVKTTAFDLHYPLTGFQRDRSLEEKGVMRGLRARPLAAACPAPASLRTRPWALSVLPIRQGTGS